MVIMAREILVISWDWEQALLRKFQVGQRRCSDSRDIRERFIYS